MSEVHVQATEYLVSVLPIDHVDVYSWSITVVLRGPGDRWAVCWHSQVLNRSGEWEYEPNPSSRSAAFKARTRFPMPKAIDLACEAAPKIVVCGMTAADVLTKDAAS